MSLSGSGGGPLFGPPGSYKQRQEGGKNEPNTAARWFGYHVLGWFLCILAVYGILLLVGPLWSGTLALFGAMCWVVARFTGQERTGAVMLGVAFFIGLIAWWLLGGGAEVVDAEWPAFGRNHYRLDLRWPWWGRLAPLPFFIFFIHRWSKLGAFRSGYETVDPEWPPTLKARDPHLGPAYPGVQYSTPPVLETPEQVDFQQYPRPIPVHGAAPARQMVVAPDGKTLVSVDILSQMIRFEDFAYRRWQNMASRTEWEGATALLASLGIIHPPQPRKKTELVVPKVVAYQMLEQAVE